MTKEECGHDHHECDHDHPEVSTEDIARHNHFIINALVKVLVDKKVIAAEDINKAVVDLQDMMKQKME